MAEHDPNAPTLFDLGDLTTDPPKTSFMDLEDPRYAYMFGFLQADGHLAQGAGLKGRLTVEINVRDIATLRDFQQLTPYNSSITERTRSTNFAASSHTATWTLCSVEARTALSELGLPYGRKSKRITPPRVPFSRPDYLRGVIDADGSVGFTADGIPFVSLTTASTAVAAYLCHYTRRVFGIHKMTGRNKRDGLYNVMYVRESAVTLVQHLYTPDALALERTRRMWTALEDRLLLSAESLEEAATALDRSYPCCQLRRWRLLKN